MLTAVRFINLFERASKDTQPKFAKLLHTTRLHAQLNKANKHRRVDNCPAYVKLDERGHPRQLPNVENMASFSAASAQSSKPSSNTRKNYGDQSRKIIIGSKQDSAEKLH
jgi:hypothetical protein